MKKLLKKIAGTILVVVALACGTATLFSCDKGSVNVTLVSESVEKTVFVAKSGDALPVVTAEDRDFEGYWLDSSYTRKYEGVVVPESDVTLYYKQNYQYYTLNLDYGDKGVVSVALRRGVNEVLPDIAPDGTIVAAYSDSSDGEATVLAGGSVKNLAAKGETATLFVKYEIKDVADYVIEDGEVKAYKGKKTQLVLPYGATRIAENAFKDNEKIVSVYVPATYEKIGKGAFSGCKNLETLTVPFIGGSKTSKSFMAYVFGAENYKDNTYSFAAYTDGKSLYMGDLHLENQLFPEALTTVRINSEITEISEGAFYSAYSLENVALDYPQSLTAVGKSAFENCLSLGKASDTSSYICFNWLSYVKTIGERAFASYTGNTETEVKEIYPYGEKYEPATLIEYSYPFNNLVKIPSLDNIESIGKNAFYYCAAIDNLSLGKNLKTIGDGAFFFCISIPTLVFPDSLETIGETAFYANQGVLDIKFGTGIKEIKTKAFASCAGLSQVVFTGEDAPLLGKEAFCNELTYDEESNSYNMKFTGFQIIVPSAAENDYKSSFTQYGDYIHVAKNSLAPAYWGKKGEITTMFRFTDGGIVYVTDEGQAFMKNFDYGNFGEMTYGKTCGEFFPMMYKVLSEEEYARLAPGQYEGRHSKKLYANQRVIKLWHPQFTEFDGSMVDLYFTVTELPFEHNGATYLLPRLLDRSIVCDYGDKTKVNSYIISVNRFGLVMLGTVTRLAGGVNDVKWIDDPEGTYYSDLDTSVKGEFTITYYDENFNVIQKDTYLQKKTKSYEDSSDALYKKEENYLKFEINSGYNDANEFYVDGLGGAKIKIGDKTYTAATVIEDSSRKFGEVGYTLSFADISLDGKLDSSLAGTAVFKMVSGGEYMLIKVTVGGDSYEFVNVTYNNDWYRYAYGEITAINPALPQKPYTESGYEDLNRDDWRYLLFTDPTIKNVINMYLYAPDGKNAPSFAYYREYGETGVIDYCGQIKGYTGEGEFVMEYPDGDKTAEIYAKRGSFKIGDRKFTRYDDSEDMTLAAVEDFYGTTLYYYTVKADGFGNMYIRDEHDDDFDDVYFGTYDDYNTFPSANSNYYELQFTGRKVKEVDKDGNIVFEGEEVKYWILYDFSTLSSYSDEYEYAQWYGTLAGIYTNHDDTVLTVSDDFGNKRFEIKVDIYGNVSFTEYEASYNAKGEVTLTVRETPTVAGFVAVLNTDGEVDYLIATDKDGNGLFSVRPKEGYPDKLIIVKDGGVVTGGASDSEKVEIDYSQLKKIG